MNWFQSEPKPCCTAAAPKESAQAEEAAAANPKPLTLGDALAAALNSGCCTKTDR